MRLRDVKNIRECSECGGTMIRTRPLDGFACTACGQLIIYGTKVDRPIHRWPVVFEFGGVTHALEVAEARALVGRLEAAIAAVGDAEQRTENEK